MNKQKLIDRFNKPDTHLVISAWPERGRGKRSYHGDAAYTRESLLTLVKRHNMRFVVIAEVNHDNRPQIVANGNILILRVIDHGKFHVYPTVLTWLAKFSQIKQVTVHSNFTYSGIQHFVLLIPFLLLIKLTGRKITHFAHNVVDSIDFLAKQLNLTNKVVISVLNSGIRLYNNLLGSIVDHLIVLDAQGKEIMNKYISPKKLIYNPHWVKSRTTHWTKRSAKNKLGIPESMTVLLCFGFVSWYKGTDKLVRMYKNTKNNTNNILIFAGGQSRSMANSIHYQKYYSKFKNEIDNQANMRLTGFLPDNQLGLYFAAADLVVLPYRGLMGGSGVLAYAIGYKKPFLISNKMKSIWKNPDMKISLQETDLNKKQMMFSLNQPGMNKIFKIVENPKLVKKLKQVSKSLLKSRNIELMTDAVYNEVYRKDSVLKTLSELKYESKQSASI